MRSGSATTCAVSEASRDAGSVEAWLIDQVESELGSRVRALVGEATERV